MSRSADTTTPVRVLIVDDELTMRLFVAQALDEMGCRTTKAADALEALRLVEVDTFDLVVADVMMPDMSGDELGRRLRLRHPDLKILYFTGWSPALFEERNALWEGEAFLDKPATDAGLREAVSLLMFGTPVPPTSLP